MVTKNVPDYALVKGNPAKVTAWLDKKGNKLSDVGEGKWADIDGKKYYITEGKLQQI